MVLFAFQTLIHDDSVGKPHRARGTGAHSRSFSPFLALTGGSLPSKGGKEAWAAYRWWLLQPPPDKKYDCQLEL